MDNKSIDNFFSSLSKDELKERWEKYNKYSESGEGENGGWIKIQSEADLPKGSDDFWVINNYGEIHMTEYNSDHKKFHGYFIERDGIVTHYQPITKPLPPKF